MASNPDLHWEPLVAHTHTHPHTPGAVARQRHCHAKLLCGVARRSCGVTASTLDSESSNRGSNPRRTWLPNCTTQSVATITAARRATRRVAVRHHCSVAHDHERKRTERHTQKRTPRRPTHARAHARPHNTAQRQTNHVHPNLFASKSEAKMGQRSGEERWKSQIFYPFGAR